MDFDITDVRKLTKMVAPAANFDAALTFYYDETNNIRKFYVRENDFNACFKTNFVLGGIAHAGNAPNVDALIDSFKLQKTTKEVKFKHIAKGSFLECLTSKKLNLFLEFIDGNKLLVHYSSLNILYWSIADIVDSAIMNSDAAQALGPDFANHLKNDLYKLSKLEIDAVIALFYRFGYPNIKVNQITSFIEDLTRLFDNYIDEYEFHIGLESLRQILKASGGKKLSFIMNGDDHILLQGLSEFYLRPVYMFKNSTHIFDNEDLISETFKKYRIFDQKEEILNYSFIDSQESHLVQLSDIYVGLMGKLFHYINTHEEKEIENDFDSLTPLQAQNIDLFFHVIDKSCNQNIGLIHSTDSYVELNKLSAMRDKRKKMRHV